MKVIKISNTDENADWIKSLSDDVEVSEMAIKQLGEGIYPKQKDLLGSTIDRSRKNH